MSNFTLSEPPVPGGKTAEDINALYSWCRELYESLWLNQFVAAQIRKAQSPSQDE